MNDKDYYLKFWGYTPGTSEAEEAWKLKLQMNNGAVFLPLPVVFVAPNICYDSPVDGRHITSKQARIEDLKRHNCIEYDPEMRTDYQRRIKDNEASLEKHVEETVDREIATMPSRKREKLTAELEGGLTAEPVRQTRSAS